MKGVFYPVRTVALLLVLLFPTFTAIYATATNLSEPICTTVEGSGKKYEICLTDVTYNYQAGTSTWTYTARTITGNAISHVTFGIPCGTEASDYTSASGCAAIEYGNDPTTGVNGIKFDCGTGTNSITYSFTIKGLYSIGIIDYAIKTGGSGQREFVYDGFGPSCSSITPLPTGSACANAVAYLSNYGLITIDDLNTNSDVHYNVFVGGDLIRYPGGGDYLGSDGIFSTPTERSLEVAGQVKSGANIKYSGAFTPPSTNTITKINSSQYQVNGYAYNLNTSGAELVYDITLEDKAAQIKNDLELASAQLANAVVNNTTTGNLTFNVDAKDANGIAVFHINASDIAQNANVQLNNNVNANTIIINVSGTNVNWTSGVNVNISQSNWSKILWNFHEATNIAVNSLKGVVLAPYATFSSNSANEGSVAVKTYSGNGEIHRPYFSGDFSSVCGASAPEIQLNLTAECKVGNTLYWRVTGDDDVNNVAFSWNGPGSNDGTGLVNVGDHYYFTTQDAGGANTTVISWFDPSTGSYKTKTKAHNNRDCVYHIELEKEWQGAPAPNLSNTIILTAESSIATASCGYDGNGNWYCDYSRKSNGSSSNDLEVPFGETYSVTEQPVSGWMSSAGEGNGFEYVTGFDNTALPDALVYELSNGAFAEPIAGKAAKYGLHTLVNSKVTPSTRQIGIRVYLQGGYMPRAECPPLELPENENDMTSFLQQQSLLPTLNPYGLPESYFDINNPNGAAGKITDWIKVELRDGSNFNALLEEKAGLLQVDGDVVDENGDPLVFQNIMNPVYIVIKHRNHITISSPIVSLNDGDVYDFSTSIDKAFGSNSPMAAVNGIFAMWGGDANGDGMVFYGFPGNDKDAILSDYLGGNTFGFLFGYYNADLNLDGIVMYNFPGNDKDWLLAYPLEGNLYGFRSEQLPSSIGSKQTNSVLAVENHFLKNENSNQTLPAVSLENRFSDPKANIFPNPNAIAQATLELSAVSETCKAFITVTNLNGEVLYSQQVDLVKGFNQILIDTGDLLPGMYLIQIKGTKEIYAPIKLMRVNR